MATNRLANTALTGNPHGSRRIAQTADPTNLDSAPVLAFTPLRLKEPHHRLDRARAAADGHTALVCAPAGSGKTVLVADWLRRRRPAPLIGWVDLADIATSTEQLWPAVRSALGLAPSAPRDEFTDHTAAPASIVTALADRGEPAVLVLDDAHRINDPVLLAGLQYLFEHAPPVLTTVVVGRYDPPLRWHRLQMAGRLTRIGARELAFEPTDVAALLAQHSYPATPEDIARIHDMTCGWAGVVRIAAIHLEAHTDDRATALTALERGPRAVADFLVGELLTSLSTAEREFLLAVSVPAAFSVELAEELAGTSARTVLDLLLRKNFPIDARAGDGALWYSLHPMLRTYLLAEAADTDHDRIVAVHRTCADWHIRTGRLPTALHHVLATGDRASFVAFVRDYGARMVFEGRGTTLFREFDSSREFADDAFVVLLRIADSLERSDTAQVVALRETLGAREDLTSTFASPALLHGLADTVGADRCEQPPAHLTPTGDPVIDCYITVQAGSVRAFESSHEEGRESMLHQALMLAHSADVPYLALQALTRLAGAAGVQGRLTPMDERARAALALAEQHDLSATASAVQAQTIVALVGYLRCEQPAGEVRVGSSRSDHDGSSIPVAGRPTAILAQLFGLDTAPDRHHAAQELRSEMLRLLEENPAPLLTAGLWTQVTWAMLRIHWLESAHSLLRRGTAVLGVTAETTLLEAAVAYAERRVGDAAAQLGPLLDRDHELDLLARIEARLLHAVVCHHLERPRPAHDSLQRALALADGERIIRPFTDVPGAVELLDRFVGCFGQLDRFVDTIRDSAPPRAHADAIMLTSTELSVLRHLPSAMTTQSIADDLGVSINTVKTHLRGIYQKLGARSRADAIMTARTAGLI